MDVRERDEGELTLRVGDAEREACVSVLIDQHLQGRLSVEELNRRQRLALAAVTTDDFRLLLADLPVRELASPTLRRRGSVTDVVVGGDVKGRSIKMAASLLPVAPVLLGGAWFSQWSWEHTAEGPFLGALAGGALGYALHAVMSQFRR